MNLVNQVNLEAGMGRRVLDVLQQFARILDLGPRGCINLDKVNTAALRYLKAGGTFPAGLRTHTTFTVEAFGQNSGNGGFANTACAGKQLGMVQPIIVQRMNQRLEHMLLADHLPKHPGPPFSRQNLVGHAV